MGDRSEGHEGRRTIVVIGGVAGGAGAAAKARRTDEHAEIVVFERGPHVSFANCGLPMYVGGEIARRDDLLLQTPESFWRRFRIRVHVRHEVVRIDRAGRRVEVRDLTSGATFWQGYTALVLAPGAGAIVPPWPGLPAPNVFTVKTVPDSDAIRAWIAERSPRRAVVVGAGFIGLETAEALQRRGLHVTIVEALPQVAPTFDADVAVLIERHLREQGVDVITGDAITRLEGGTAVEAVALASGKLIPTDLVVVSVGVRPELKLARDAGLAIGAAGGIAVDDRQRTSDPSIFAAGDATEVTHLVTGAKVRLPMAGPANKQGRVAGCNAAGGDMRFPGVYGTAIVEVLGLVAARTGLSAREAAAAGLAFDVSYTHSLDHAGYYPGAEMMHLKLVVERGTARLLGAQVVGERGVDKRIDVLATALAAGMKVTDLENLDLAYAPQFSSAKDPVVMAGFVAANVARGEIATVTCAELRGRVADGADLQLVDVRTPAEFATGHLPGARSVPIDELRDRLGELDPARPTVVYCKVGFRGYLAARLLQQSGFGAVENLSGGLLVCQE